MLVDPTGKVQAELDEKEGIAFGEIGKHQAPYRTPAFTRLRLMLVNSHSDVDLINKTRKGIPISVQRRFDCYTSVAKA